MFRFTKKQKPVEIVFKRHSFFELSYMLRHFGRSSDVELRDLCIELYLHNIELENRVSVLENAKGQD